MTSKIEVAEPTHGRASSHRGIIGPFAAIVVEAEPAGPSPDRILAGTPVGTVTEFYTSCDEKVQSGRWTCTPGRWRVVYDETEFCRIISGTGAVIDADGFKTAIAAGDEFIIPAGFTGEWEVNETMTKTYVIVQP